MFSLFPKDFKVINLNNEDSYNLRDLKTKIDKIYENKNEILDILKAEDKNEKEKKTKKEKKFNEKINNIFLFFFNLLLSYNR